jgi:hypothetical protein
LPTRQVRISAADSPGIVISPQCQNPQKSAVSRDG